MTHDQLMGPAMAANRNLHIAAQAHEAAIADQSEGRELRIDLAYIDLRAAELVCELHVAKEADPEGAPAAI